ncbi:MAG: amidohydrolase family protein [Deltaproteobacteria bacterium]|nr:amidohydrolase family protein [Deltaproteobacteria bacterium]
MLYALLLFFLAVGVGWVQAQTPAPLRPDTLFQRLLAAIRQIPIIDNHAHPGLPGDPEMDALTFAPNGLAAMEPFSLPVRLRPTNPEYVQALRVLYDYPHADLTADHVRELTVRKQQKRAVLGVAYFNEVLDRAGIAVSLANRVGMNSAPLDRSRFKWVPLVDAYLFPLNNTVYKKMNADYRVFFSSEERLLRRYLDQVEAGRPRGFDAYLQFVRESLARLKAEGAIAVAFEAAYLRTLRFDDPPHRRVRRIYERYRSTTEVPEDEYRDLQDYLFRYLLREATKLGLPVHLHTGLPVGNAASLTGANPLHLENILNNPQYRKTTFVLLNGGYPFTREAILLAGKPNVYVDPAGQLTLFLPAPDLAQIFKEWLAFYPEKVLFGTDAMVLSTMVGAEEAYWLAAETGRQALAQALSEMVQEGRCDEAQALHLARLVLHDNTAKLYGLP